MLAKLKAYRHYDKVLHAAGGSVIGALVALVTGNPWLALACVNLVGWVKEQYDSYHPDKHTVDPWDALATLGGGVVGTLVVVLA